MRLALLAGVSAALACAAQAQRPLKPPPARVEAHREVLHGVELRDPYRWLDNLGSAEVREWLERQNAYTRAVLEAAPGHAAIQKRLAELGIYDTISAPTEVAGRFFFEKRMAREPRASLCMRRSATGPDVVLIDPARVSPDSSVAVQYMAFSIDGKRAAYSVRQGGRDEISVAFLDVDSGKDLADRLDPALYSSVAIEPSNQGFYYVRRSRQTGSRVFYRKFGAPVASERLVFERSSPDQFVGLNLSDHGGYLLIPVQHGWARSEVYFLDLQQAGAVRPLITGVDGLFNSVWAGVKTLLVQTTWEAPNRRIVRIDLDKPGREHWRVVVPEAGDAIQSFDAIGGEIYVTYLRNVQAAVERFSLDGKRLDAFALPGIGMASVRGRWNSTTGVATFTSFTDASSIFLFDTKSGKRRDWFRPAVPLDASRLEVRQVWYSSPDGTGVPMFLVHAKGLRLDGQRPTLLYGYGGFNVSQTPSFRPTAILFAESGGVFALANIRGGGEFGEKWHRAGMLDKKQNVFDDFIAAAEWLVSNRYTNSSKLAIQGASNGGLLMGAALTQRPDLFRTVLCEYPDLDMIRYYRYKENNNPPALLEYGNASIPGEFRFIQAYSPYEKVRPSTRYPSVLFTTGDGDTRVPPQQACKMAAKLQAATSSGRPVLLKFNFRSGHAGGRTLEEAIADIASRFAFVFSELGVRYGDH